VITLAQAIWAGSAPLTDSASLYSMGDQAADVELISFHSISKGMVGECGRRGGYFECVNIDPEVMDQIYKLASISLCPTVPGQILVDLMVNPPKPGSPSFEQYDTEMKGIYGKWGRAVDNRRSPIVGPRD
jgi:aspartate/methionine/tyrosine aminotransferase